ncbi:MAG: ThuA domain-containing protein [Akkermansiaceae bacterium]|nr:ThuA domain-containing protein [Akkermansiaceae bacterium]
MKTIAALVFFSLLGGAAVTAETFPLLLRDFVKREDGTFQRTLQRETWKAAETAVIVCDMWDAHHCLNATKRGGQMASRMNAVLKEARARGATIIHAPSSCTDFYKDHPARARALAVEKATNLPVGIEQWMHWIDAEEEKAGYPIDASDGGEDDGKAEHEQWAKALEGRGRNPGSPWIRQTAGLEIDGEKDYITDDGNENWSILEQNGIKNVVLVGVHTNMCVLGRPFGLRQLSRSGKNVALMRDMTDTMYNPKMKPFVSHYQGTDLIIDHVEKYVCRTITSDQILGGSTFSFDQDTRKHLVILAAEKEYHTGETLAKFAEEHLAKHFRVSYVYANPDDQNDLLGLEALDDADIALISVRRRAPRQAQMDKIRSFAAAGKPFVGIRTASHAFSLRGKPAPEGHGVWEKFDPDIWGGNYSGHHGNKLKSSAWVADGATGDPVVAGVKSGEFATGGSLYQVLPLEKGAKVLLMGKVEGHPHEPVAWTFKTAAGGKTFCTSLGHIDDFANENFTTMLKNALLWAAEVKK